MASNQVNSIAAGGRFLYLKSAKDAPRFKVLRLDLPAADLATAKTLLAAGEDVVAELAAAKEGLYVTRRKGPAKTLVRFPHAEQAAPETVALPFEGSVDLVDANGRSAGLVIEMGSWTRAAKHYLVAPGKAMPSRLA